MLSADDTFYRSMGQAAAGGNATNRDAELLALDSAELDADISRREEWLCAQCLVVGKIGCLDGDTGKPVAELDYGPISKTVTAKPWSDPTSNPLTDLKSAQRLVSGASGFSADVIVMGKDAADAFEANANVMEGFNKMFIQQGTLNPSAVTVGDEIPDEDVPARIAKYAVRDQEDVASAIGPGVMKDDEPELQDTARASDDEEDVKSTDQPYADALASEREHGDDWHPAKPKQKRYVRLGMAFKPGALEKLKPAEPLFVIDPPGAFPAKFKRIGKVKGT